MKNLIILFALFTFVGLSTEMIAQTTTTTTKTAKATKVPLNAVKIKPAKKACCAKSAKSSCSKAKAGATSVSLTTKAATEKKACTKGEKKACAKTCTKGAGKACCAKDKAETSVESMKTTEKKIEKKTGEARPALSHARERQNN